MDNKLFFWLFIICISLLAGLLIFAGGVTVGNITSQKGVYIQNYFGDGELPSKDFVLDKQGQVNLPKKSIVEEKSANKKR